MNEELNYKLKLDDLFTPKMKAAILQTQKLDKAMSNTGKGGGGGLLGKIAGGNLLANAITSAAGAVVDFGKSVVDSLTKYEYFQSSLRTLLHGNKLEAQALSGQLVELAKTTPFSLEDVQNGTKQLLAYGFEAGNITSDLKTLGDVSSGVGAPLGDIVYLYGTLKTQGRAFAKDINQFTGRGIPIVAELAKQFKVTESKVMDLVGAGKVGFPEIEKAFKSMTKEGGQFFGMMDEQSKTVGGKISNLGDSWEQLKVGIGKSQKGIIASTIEFASSIVDSLNQAVAAENRMDEAFANSKFGKTEGFNFWDKIKMVFAGTLGPGSLQKNDMFRSTVLDARLQKLPSSNIEEVAKSQMVIQGMIMDNQMKINKQNELVSSPITTQREKAIEERAQLERERAQLNSRLDEIVATGGLLSKKGSPLDKGGKGGDELAGIEKSLEKPQNLYITINKLIETQVIEAENVTESLPKIKTMVSQALLEAVNDINNMKR